MATDIIEQTTMWLATGTEGIAGVLIALAVLEAGIRTMTMVVRYSAAVDLDRSYDVKSRERSSVLVGLGELGI